MKEWKIKLSQLVLLDSMFSFSFLLQVPYFISKFFSCFYKSKDSFFICVVIHDILRTIDLYLWSLTVFQILMEIVSIESMMINSFTKLGYFIEEKEKQKMKSFDCFVTVFLLIFYRLLSYTDKMYTNFVYLCSLYVHIIHMLWCVFT